MDWLPALVALLIVVLFPVLDRGRVADLRERPTEGERLRVYTHSLLALWFATAAALLVESDWQPLRMQPALAGHWFARYQAGVDIAAYVVCAAILLILAQGLTYARNAARRRAIAPAFDRLAFLLPVSRRERRWWILLSLSAGICEELLFRSYLWHFFQDGGMGWGLPATWVLTSAAFGLAHLYQGWRGVLTSTAMGLVFGLLALGTGSLLVPIVLHGLLDLQVLWMYRPDLDQNFPK